MTTPNDATIASEKSEHRKQSDAEISAMHYKSDFKNLLFHVVTFYSPCAGSCLNIKGSALNALDHILAASVGGIITAFAVCPLDVVKVRLQAQIDAMSEPQGPRQFHSHLHLHFRGTLDALFKIARYEGVLSLWRGLSPTLLMTVPGVALYFTTYEAFKKRWHSYFNSLTPLIAGAAARTVTAIATCPLEMFRTNIQSHNRNIGALQVFRIIIRRGRILRQLWRGLMPTLFRDVPFSAIYWMMYETVKNSVRKSELSRWTSMNSFVVPFISGASAGAFAATVTVPFDVLKTRMQMDIDQHFVQKSVIRIFREIIHTEGWRGLTKGVVPRATRVAPACAIMISCYEIFSRRLAKRKHNHDLNLDNELQ
jgi:solute carrier family 25 protein 39/40